MRGRHYMKRLLLFTILLSLFLAGCSFSNQDKVSIPDNFSEKTTTEVTYHTPPSKNDNRDDWGYFVA